MIQWHVLILSGADMVATSEKQQEKTAGIDDMPASCAAVDVRKAIESSEWHGPEATGQSLVSRPVHLTVLRFAFRNLVNSVFEGAVTGAIAGDALAVRIAAILRLAHACVCAALLEVDAARFVLCSFTQDGQDAQCATLLRSCGTRASKALHQAMLLFEPLPPQTTSGPTPYSTSTPFAFHASVSAQLLSDTKLGEVIHRGCIETPTFFAHVANALAHNGYAVVKDVFDVAVVDALAAEVFAMDLNTWQRSSVKVTGSKTSREDLTDQRGDCIWWLDGCDRRRPLLSALVQWLRHSLVNSLRSTLCRPGCGGRFSDLNALSQGAGFAADNTLSLERTPMTLPPAMLACYPGGGARFAPHIDNNRSMPDNRIITAMFYLNASWGADEGGALRLRKPCFPGSGSLLPVAEALAPPEALLEVLPERNTLVLFWSHVVEHEVLPAFRPRYAVSMWLRTAAEERATPAQAPTLAQQEQHDV